MSKMIQIRNVPETIHRRLKSRAAAAGLSLSDYLLSELRELASVPSDDELYQRAINRPLPSDGPAPAELLRQERDSR